MESEVIRQGVDSRERMAENLLDRFLDTRPTSLLIRGPPGAGKTTLALELLRASNRPGYYISTRVSLKRIRAQFPWVADLLKDEYTITSTNDVHDGSNHDGNVPVVDARLGSARGILERVLDFIFMHRSSVIILDSWDAIAKEADKNERLKAEKSMVYMADANDGMLIFISEEPEENTVSYLVDGVITLDMEYRDGFRMRKMMFDKMRGVEVKHSMVPYTLKGSRFTPLPVGISYSYPEHPRYFEHITARDGFISTGNRDLDEALHGGIKKGSIVLLERDQSVSKSYITHLFACLVLNALRSGIPAFTTPAPYVPVKSIMKYIKPFCRREEIRLYTIFTKDEEHNDDVNVCRLTDDATLNVNQTCSLYMGAINRYRSALLTCDTSLATVNYNLDDVLNGMKKVKASDGILLMISGKDSPLFNAVQSVSDVHMRIWEENGVTMLRLVRPYNGVYAMLLESSAKGYPAYRLIEVV
ncbi:MAG: ATPase domain-containing protein [Candidatus Nitrosocaldus sp.]|nr:ATPase domain-containing protein [Candidatus Nitrosocaldus sp.]